MTKLKIISIGESLGVVLPKEVLARLRVDKGDTVFLTDSPDSVRITATNSTFESQLKSAEELARKRRDALAELAK